MYIGVAVPKMLYAADVWCTPIYGRSSAGRQFGLVGAIKALAHAQRTASRAILGGLSTSAMDTLDAHTNLLPMELLVQKHCIRAATHLVSLSPPHPLYPLVKQCTCYYVKHHKSSIHHLLHLNCLYPSRFEKI